jgi:hypothetical protein
MAVLFTVIAVLSAAGAVGFPCSRCASVAREGKSAVLLAARPLAQGRRISCGMGSQCPSQWAVVPVGGGAHREWRYLWCTAFWRRSHDRTVELARRCHVRRSRWHGSQLQPAAALVPPHSGSWVRSPATADGGVSTCPWG